VNYLVICVDNLEITKKSENSVCLEMVQNGPGYFLGGYEIRRLMRSLNWYVLFNGSFLCLMMKSESE